MNAPASCEQGEGSQDVGTVMGLAAVGVSQAKGVVVAVVLVAAVAHAGWNLLAKLMDDQVVAFWLINATAVVCGAGMWAIAGTPRTSAWPYLATSVVLHIAYNLTLLNSYRFGDLNQVYPLARGLAPLLVTGGAALVAGEGLGTLQLVGVAVIAGGLVSLVWLGGAAPTGGRRSIVLAALTGVLIATYSLSDGLGVRHAHDTIGYAGMLFVVESSILVIGLAAWRRRVLPELSCSGWTLGIVGGALSVAAYGAVLWAQTRLALGVVSALRETSVVAAAVLGGIFLHEGSARRRLVAALVVCAGVALLVVA
ncbi:MAG: EamA family transporter [Acidimicrobiales bacterium]